MTELLDNMGVARKLFRLFKSLNEWDTIRKHMSDPAKNALPILARAAFLFYWLFDNLAVLIKIKFIQGWDLKSMSRRATKCWLLGIWLSILIALMDLAKVAKEEA